MILIKSLKLNEIYDLIGKKVVFTSDCDFFPNFKVECKIISIDIKNNEFLFEVITTSKKKLIIGSRMKNLSYALI